MYAEVQHPRFLELLVQSDELLLATDLGELKAKLANASSFQEDGFWSDDLADYIHEAGPSHAIHFHWIAEQHYAKKLKNPDLLKHFNHYYLIGYARIISLLM